MRRTACVLGLALCLMVGKASTVLASEHEEIQRTGGLAAEELMKALKGELRKALAQGGPTAAISVCSLNAAKIARSIEADLGGGVKIKRTSERYRNPANAPDQLEQEALEHFRHLSAEGQEMPSFWIQEERQGERVDARYYRPIMVGALCLVCHGDAQTMDPAVRAKIRSLYPGDLATGYRAGDFRGVIRISIPLGDVSSDAPAP